MGRQIQSPRPALAAHYPRVGEPIVPLLLQSLIFDRHPSPDPGADAIHRVTQAGAKAWRILPAEICRRVAMKVVDRVQSRLPQLPASALATPLPDPVTALGYDLERRTINILNHTLASHDVEGSWTLGRYLALPRFGARAIVDLLAAIEAHEGHLARRASSLTTRQLEEEVAFVLRHLPISEARVRASLHDAAPSGGTKIDLPRLARAWVQRGNSVPFRVATLGGARIAVRPDQVTAARVAYRTALRAIAFGGSASISEITTQLAGLPSGRVDATFAERLFSNLVTFRWIDRAAGVFWFAGAAFPTSTPAHPAVSRGGASTRARAGRSAV